jgi:hypothetical protein
MSVVAKFEHKALCEKGEVTIFQLYRGSVNKNKINLSYTEIMTF